MSGWIKFEKDMANDPRLLEIAVKMADAAALASGNRDLTRQESVNLFCNALRGALVTLWCYADTHIHDDDTLDMGAAAVEALTGIDRFCELLPKEWVDFTADGSVILPGYCEKNGLISRRKRTAMATERVRKFRQKRNALQNGKKRGRNAGVTAEDQDQDQDKEKANGASAPREYPEEFENTWQALPPREGDNPKNQAFQSWRARLKEGHTTSEMHDGALRYRAYCKAKDQIGTSFVMQGKRFFGVNKPFKNSWKTSERKVQASDFLGGV